MRSRRTDCEQLTGRLDAGVCPVQKSAKEIVLHGLMQAYNCPVKASKLWCSSSGRICESTRVTSGADVAGYWRIGTMAARLLGGEPPRPADAFVNFLFLSSSKSVLCGFLNSADKIGLTLISGVWIHTEPS